jgi:multiple sugar transport system permease protein
MVIPAQVTTLPLFLMLNKVGLLNTYLGVIVAGMATIYGIF